MRRPITSRLVESLGTCLMCERFGVQNLNRTTQVAGHYVVEPRQLCSVCKCSV